MALFLGGFALINVVAGSLSPAFDANVWWIDLRWLPGSFARALLAVGGTALLLYGLVPPRARWRRNFTLIIAGTLAAIALLNCVQFYALLSRGAIGSRVPVPLSALACAALLGIARSVSRSAHDKPRARALIPVLGIAAVCGLLFPLLQMFCFGKTDYRRPADVAVVFGARVYADGRPSDALADRVRTGCDLYRNGVVKKLMFSGGPGDGAVHETESMKNMAIRLGVRPEDILLDKDGLNTWATVKNTGTVFRNWGAPRILVVSHFYHLPRIKLTYQREGLEVYTVPARESYLLRQLPYNMAREIAALWVYYARPLPRLFCV